MCFHYLSIKLCSKAIPFENPHFRHWNGKWKSSIFAVLWVWQIAHETVHSVITFERWYSNTYFNIEITYYSNTIWNAHFDSNSDFSCFMSNASKTGFSTVSTKYAVHRAEYYALCGRHRFSRIFNIIYFPSNTMKPVICILTGFIIGSMDWIHVLYIKQSIYVIPLINHFCGITGAFNCRAILWKVFRGNIYNNSNSDSNC